MRSVLSLAVAGIAAAALAGPASATVLSVPDAYPTIQSAVNAAQPGDTIVINSKTATSPNGPTYNENVHINTANLKLQGVGGPVMDGTGLNNGTIVQPGEQAGDNAITVNAEGVEITGLTIQNYEYPLDSGFFPPASGVQVLAATSNLHDNTFTHDAQGITIDGSNAGSTAQNHTVLNNTAQNCTNSGFAFNAVVGSLTVQGNTATGNVKNGIQVGNSGGIAITYNNASNNGASGIVVASDTGNSPNVIEFNTISSNGMGFGGSGVELDFCTNERVDGNTVDSNLQGLGVVGCNGVKLHNNVVTNSTFDGVDIVAGSTGCHFHGNTVLQSGSIGFYAEFGTSGNLITGGNVATGSGAYDAFDDTGDGVNPKSVANKWGGDSFGTTNPPGLGS